MAILYRHIRQDKDEVFYIGIGGEKSRAYSTHHRNDYWNNIVALNPNYEVEIVFDDLTWEEACEKEIEFIKLYGRRDINTGTLCNLTIGGEGVVGNKWNDEQRKRQSDAKMKDSKLEKTILCYKIDGTFYKEFYGIKKASRELNMSYSAIAGILHKKSNHVVSKGYTFFFKESETYPLIINTDFIIKNPKFRIVLELDQENNIISELTLTELRTKIDVPKWRIPGDFNRNGYLLYNGFKYIYK